jgi:hypothetical protein
MSRDQRRQWKQRGPEFKHNSCNRKIMFKTQEEADAAISTTPNDRKTPLHSYKCNYCIGYHIGHKTPDKWLNPKSLAKDRRDQA